METPHYLIGCRRVLGPCRVGSGQMPSHFMFRPTNERTHTLFNKSFFTTHN